MANIHSTSFAEKYQVEIKNILLVESREKKN